MSLSPAMLDAMVASGCSAEQIAAIVKASLAEQEERAASKRAKDAERQRRHRASRDVTVTECDSVTEPLSRPPNENNSNPPTHTPETQTPARKGADPFPCPDWADPALWTDLKTNRKAKRLANTATAHAKLLRDIDALVDDEWPPGRLLEAIVARGWAAAHDPRENRTPKNDRPASNPQFNRGGSTASAAELAMQRLGYT